MLESVDSSQQPRRRRRLVCGCPIRIRRLVVSVLLPCGILLSVMAHYRSLQAIYIVPKSSEAQGGPAATVIHDPQHDAAIAAVRSDDGSASTSSHGPAMPELADSGGGRHPPRNAQQHGGDDPARGSGNAPPRKPKLVLHVGLEKTATTFLQCSLCSQNNLTGPILMQDNWIFLGTCPCPRAPGRFFQHKGSAFFRKPRGNSTIEPAFRSKMERVAGGGRNAIIVFEGFRYMNEHKLRLMSDLLGPLFDVRVLVAYRPLYDWLVSKYNSVMKRNPLRRHWPGTSYKSVVWTSGQVAVSTHLVPFDLYDRPVIDGLIRSVEETGRHLADLVVRNFAEHFTNVSVIPMHLLPNPGRAAAEEEEGREEGQRRTARTASPSGSSASVRVDPLLHYLFCVELAPDAPATCAAVRAGLLGQNVPSNPSKAFHYDNLATHAHEAGLVPPAVRQRMGPDKFAFRLRSHHLRTLNRTSPNDLPLRCLPNATLARLEEMSLGAERLLFEGTPRWTPGRSEEEHRRGFARAVAGHKYCWIDADATLALPEWRSFFESLMRNESFGAVGAGADAGAG